MDDPTTPEKGSTSRTTFDNGDLFDALFGGFGFNFDDDLAEHGIAHPPYRQAFCSLVGQ